MPDGLYQNCWITKFLVLSVCVRINEVISDVNEHLLAPVITQRESGYDEAEGYVALCTSKVLYVSMS